MDKCKFLSCNYNNSLVQVGLVYQKHVGLLSRERKKTTNNNNSDSDKNVQTLMIGSTALHDRAPFITWRPTNQTMNRMNPIQIGLVM